MIRLAVMRPMDKIPESIKLARELGFDPICASPLEIRTKDSKEFEVFLGDLRGRKVDVLILTSSNGVASMLDLARGKMPIETFMDLIAPVRIVAIGPQTAKALGSAGLGVSHIPGKFSSEGIVEELGKIGVAGKNAYVLRSDHGEAVLLDGLRAAGAVTSEVIVYHLIPVDSEQLDIMIKESLLGKIDAFAFSSSLSAATFIEAAEKAASHDEVMAVLNSKIVAAMGEPTKKRLEAMGVKVTAVPEKATFREMLQAVKRARSSFGP